MRCGDRAVAIGFVEGKPSMRDVITILFFAVPILLVLVALFSLLRDLRELGRRREPSGFDVLIRGEDGKGPNQPEGRA